MVLIAVISSLISDIASIIFYVNIDVPILISIKIEFKVCDRELCHQDFLSRGLAARAKGEIID